MTKIDYTLKILDKPVGTQQGEAKMAAETYLSTLSTLF
jgi:hypothetical protein